MARIPHSLALVAALALLAAPAGAQTAVGVGGRAQRAESIEELRVRLAAAVDRVRTRVVALTESGDYQERHARDIQQATLALQNARPTTPEFMAAMERMQHVVRQQQLVLEDDEELKRAVKDLQRVQAQLAVHARQEGRPGYLGISFASEQVLDRGRFVMRFDEHPEVMAVEPESPAARAGLQRGDVLLAFDGDDVTRRPVVMSELLVPGRTVKVKVRRDGRTMELPVQVRRRPDAYRVFVRSSDTPEVDGFVWSPGVAVAPPAPPTPPALPGVRTVRPLPRAIASDDGFSATIERRSADGRIYERVVMLGAELMQLDDRQRDALDVDRGVLVFGVNRRSAADEAGLRAFDVVVEVGDRRVSGPVELYTMLRELNARGEKQAALEYVRDGKKGKTTLKW